MGRKPIGDVAREPYVKKGIKRGDAHHWAKADCNKVAKRGMKRGTACHLSKDYVPTANAPKYVPTGNPPGRQRLTDEERAARKYVPTGNPRGIKKNPNSKGPYVPTGKPRGHPGNPKNK